MDDNTAAIIFVGIIGIVVVSLFLIYSFFDYKKSQYEYEDEMDPNFIPPSASLSPLPKYHSEFKYGEPEDG